MNKVVFYGLINNLVDETNGSSKDAAVIFWAPINFDYDLTYMP